MICTVANQWGGGGGGDVGSAIYSVILFFDGKSIVYI